jgi:RimJ/RimL family protein N-acetyltransferase
MFSDYQIASHRFNYRLLTVDDVTENYVAWMNDPTITKYLENCDEIFNLESIKNYVRVAQENPDIYLWGIFDNRNHSHVGNIKFNYSSRKHERGDIGLIVGDVSYWNRGVATEAIKTVTKYLFDVVGVKKISAGCYECNKGSLFAFKKAGYSIEGINNSAINYEGGRINGILLGVWSA